MHTLHASPHQGSRFSVVSSPGFFMKYMATVLLALGIFFPHVQALAADAVTGTQVLTGEALEDATYLMKNTQPGKTYLLNPAQKNQQRAIVRSLSSASKTPASAPQLYKVLGQAIKNAQVLLQSQPNGDAPQMVMANQNAETQDLNTIISFDETSTSGTGTYNAAALSSVVNGTTVTTIKLSITDVTGATVYATNTQSQYSQGTDFIVPVSANNIPTGVTTMASAVITYTPQGGTLKTVYTSSSLMQPASLGCMTAPNYCVKNSSGQCTGTNETACINTGATSLKAISVCYNRGSQQSCDYYNSTGQTASNFVIPSAGSVSFATNITSPISGTWSAQVQDTVNGGACVLSQDAAMDSTQWKINNNTQLQWTMAQLSLTAPSYCLKKSGGQDLNFFFTGDVALTGAGTNAKGTFSFMSSGTVGRGNFFVPQLYFEDSCIAAGTQVKLANGQTKLIEAMSADHDDDVVQTGKGEKRKVLGTTKGVETHPMYRISTDKKQTLLLTRTHPVMTPQGPVMVRDLRVGEHVLTDMGPASIVSIAEENYTGQVHNLRLGDTNDAKDAKSTFYANGILVGDVKTQTYHEKLEIERTTNDAAHARDRLARHFPEWLVDFDNDPTRVK